MRRYVLALLAMAALCVPLVLAAPEPAAPRSDRGPRARGTRGRRETTIDRVIREVKPTPQHEVQLRQASDANRQAQTNWFQENGEEYRALRMKLFEARRDNNQEAAEALQEQIDKLNKSREGLRQELIKQAQGILTAEQFAIAEPILEGRPSVVAQISGLRRLDLPADKQAKVDAILAAALAQIKKEVLTPEQAKQLEQPMQFGFGGAAGFAGGRGRRGGRGGRGGAGGGNTQN